MIKKNKQNLSILDKDLTIDGSIASTGTLIIKGKVNGTIEGQSLLIAQEGQVISSMANVENMTIGGKFQGEMSVAKELVILSTGTCSGKVECKDLIVENGGILNAEVACKTNMNVPEVEKVKQIPKIKDAEKQITL